MAIDGASMRHCAHHAVDLPGKGRHRPHRRRATDARCYARGVGGDARGFPSDHVADVHRTVAPLDRAPSCARPRRSFEGPDPRGEARGRRRRDTREPRHRAPRAAGGPGRPSRRSRASVSHDPSRRRLGRVCGGRDDAGAPAAVREALRAAVARARALGLSLEEMDEGLAPAPAAARASKATVAIASKKG